MRSIITLVFTTALFGSAVGQKFVGTSALPVIERDGFYRVDLSPALTSHLNSSLSNVRIHDSKGIEVPYVLQAESPVYYTETFKQYEIVEKQQIKNCCTSIILLNPQGQSINNITLSIKNAEVSKGARLLGSDDKENWFALKDHFTLNSISNRKSTSEIKIVDFPLSNYAFYKIDIADSLTAPLNILAAGYYEGRSEDGKFSEIASKWTKTDSTMLKKSYLHIKFDTTHVVDRIVLKMNGAPYFLRQAKLFVKKVRVNTKKRDKYYYEPLHSFVVSSKQTSSIELEADIAQDMLIVVDNKDNPPLTVENIKVYQLNRYLAAWLKKDESYSLKFGPIDLRAPVYDIEYFQDSIPNEIETLNAAPVAMLAGVGEQPSTTFFTSKVFVWVAIVAIIGVLGFMAVKMARETSQRPNE